MSRFMVTHSLLSSWLYAMRDNPYSDATTDTNPFEEFMQTLRREPSFPNEAMQNGIIFEDLVTAIIEGERYFGFFESNDPDIPGSEPADITEHHWYKAAAKVAGIIDKGVLQYKASKEVCISGTKILLYGRLDALKGGTIYDIKCSKSYERGKYIDSTQHPMYLELVPEAERFVYVISNGNDVWTETYRRDETPDIIPTVSDFLEWLDLQGLLYEYQKHWEARE